LLEHQLVMKNPCYESQLARMEESWGGAQHALLGGFTHGAVGGGQRSGGERALVRVGGGTGRFSSRSLRCRCRQDPRVAGLAEAQWRTASRSS